MSINRRLLTTPFFIRAGLIPLIVLASAIVGQAGTYTWTGGGSDAGWTTGSNWYPLVANTGPQSHDDVLIDDSGVGSGIVTANGNRSARNVVFRRTNDFSFYTAVAPSADFTYSFNSLTTETGSGTLMLSSNGTMNNLRVSFAIAENFTVNSSVNLGRLNATTNYISSIGSVTVGGTTTLNSEGVINLSRSVSTAGTAISVDLGALKMAGGILNLTAGGAPNAGSSTTVENVVTVRSLNGTTGTIQAGKASTKGSLVITGGGTYSGTIINNAAGAVVRLTKEGSETLTLSGSNSYTGKTEIKAGTLLINGNSSAATGAVTVSSGATLGGSGTLGGATTVSGIVAPGNSIGTLTIANDVIWNGGASASSETDWKFELGENDISDLLVIEGDWIKGSGTAYRFDFSGSDNVGTFTLVEWEGTTSFSAFDFSYINLGDGLTGEFSFEGSSLQFTVVPEPGTYALLGLGATWLFIRRRNQRSI